MVTTISFVNNGHNPSQDIVSYLPIDKTYWESVHITLTFTKTFFRLSVAKLQQVFLLKLYFSQYYF